MKKSIEALARDKEALLAHIMRHNPRGKDRAKIQRRIAKIEGKQAKLIGKENNDA